MYNLHLSAEQLEIRDTVRDFVTREIKPVALKAERLDTCDRRLPMQLIDQASQIGLRTLALSEDRGGAGADHLTCCIATEELAAGDADVAAVLAETDALGRLLFAGMNVVATIGLLLVRPWKLTNQFLAKTRKIRADSDNNRLARCTETALT